MRYLLGILMCLIAGTGWALPSIRNNFWEKAPVVKSTADLDQLVKYLVRPYQKDEDKAYVLLYWIVNFVDYDEYRYDKIRDNNKSHRDLSAKIPEQEDILKTRLGVCEDISELYVQMLQQAGIEAQKISGCVVADQNWKEGKPCDAPHAWVAFWLKDQWELVDPTYAMGQANALTQVRSNRRYKKEVKKRERATDETYSSRSRRLLTEWFMRDPKLMSSDHQPSQEQWSLLKARNRKNKNLK